MALPSQIVNVDTPTGIDPVWYEKLKLIERIINSGTVGEGILALTATTGFAFLPTCVGAPTGVPLPPLGTPTGVTLAQCGYVPCVFDITDHKLWIYSGGWKGVVLA